MSVACRSRAVAAVMAFFLGVDGESVSASEETALVIDLESRTLSAEGSASGTGVPVQRTRMWLQGRKLRAEPEAEPRAVVLFDGERSTLVTVEPAAGRATRLDRETLSELEERIADARRRLEAHLESLSPEQRERSRAVLDRHPLMQGPRAVPSWTFRPTERSDAVDGRSCRVMILLRDQQESGDVCVIAWDDIDADPAELAALGEFRAFQERIHQSLGTQPTPGLPAGHLTLEKLEGYPVRVRSSDANGGVRETRLSIPRRSAVGPEHFAPGPDVVVRRIRVPASSLPPAQR